MTEREAGVAGSLLSPKHTQPKIRETQHTLDSEDYDKILCPRCGDVTPSAESHIEEGFSGHVWLVETLHCPLCGKILDTRQIRTDRIKQRW